MSMQWLPWILIVVAAVFGYMTGKINGVASGTQTLWKEVSPKMDENRLKISQLESVGRGLRSMVSVLLLQVGGEIKITQDQLDEVEIERYEFRARQLDTVTMLVTLITKRPV